MRDVCRLSVLSAITSTQQRLKLYNKVPNNGLVLYCGTVLTEDGKERQVALLSRPIRLLRAFSPQIHPPEKEKTRREKREAHQTDEDGARAVMQASGARKASLEGRASEKQSPRFIV